MYDLLLFYFCATCCIVQNNAVILPAAKRFGFCLISVTLPPLTAVKADTNYGMTRKMQRTIC